MTQRQKFDQFIKDKTLHGVDVGYGREKNSMQRVKLLPEDKLPFDLNEFTLGRYTTLSKQQRKSMQRQRKYDNETTD